MGRSRFVAVLAIFAGFPSLTSQSAVAASVGHTTYSEPFAFCRAVKNLDIHGEQGIVDNRYIGPAIPPSVLRAVQRRVAGAEEGQTTWRCMGGAVYACYLGASGRACMKTHVVRRPTKIIRAYCAQYPGTSVPNSQNDTAASWNCNGSVPVLDSAYPQPRLDLRGYLADAWVKVSP